LDALKSYWDNGTRFQIELPLELAKMMAKAKVDSKPAKKKRLVKHLPDLEVRGRG